MTTSQHRPSKTAELVAAGRAVHNRYDQPVLLEDRYAIEFCGAFWKAIVLFPPLKWLVMKVVLRGIAPVIPTILVRAIYGEQQAEIAIRRGLTQYVIVGAGYDSFAMRRTDLTKSVIVFEVDQPATQDLKRRRMAKAGIAEPKEVRYIAADLNEVPLFDALIQNGFDPEKPAFFSWFGVTYYLPEKSIEELLQLMLHEAAPGSSIAFDYLAKLETTPEYVKDRYFKCKNFVAKRGEPWITAMDPNSLESDLLKAGFSQVDHVLPWELDNRFLAGHKNLSCPHFIGVCTATN